MGCRDAGPGLAVAKVPSVVGYCAVRVTAGSGVEGDCLSGGWIGRCECERRDWRLVARCAYCDRLAGGCSSPIQVADCERYIVDSARDVGVARRDACV